MKYYIFLFLTCCLIACETDKTTSKNLVKRNFFNPKDSEYSFKVEQSLGGVGRDSVVKWKGYQKYAAELQMFQHITPNEILRNSNVLLKNAQLMKDSIPAGALQKSGLKPRVNAIYCQVLRIHDMKTIKSINAKEIITATEELFALQNMLHKKINALYQQLYFDIELDEADYFFGVPKDTLL